MIYFMLSMFYAYLFFVSGSFKGELLIIANAYFIALVISTEIRGIGK